MVPTSLVPSISWPLMPEMDIKWIMERLPHRYPLLMLDRVVEFEPNVRIVASKNVTINEEFFQGTFRHSR